MTDQNNQEPTMEEILASIRRIISEDDPPAAGAAEAPAEAPVAAAPAPLEDFEEEEEILELTDRVEPEPVAPEPEPEPAPMPLQSMGDLDVFPTESPAPEPVRAPAPVASSFDGESLIGAPAASSAASAFAALTQTISMPRDGRNLEDVVRELLRPLMKQWLDENLPRIVEDAVQTEVERIARRHG